jgi:hypothetical protein
MEAHVEVLKSKRDKDKLNINGYLYTKERNHEDRIYWKCEQWRSAICSARAVTNSENNLLKYDDSKHRHPPNANRSEIAKVSSQLKHRAKTTNDQVQVQIVQDVMAPLTLETRANLPSHNALKKQAKRVRRADPPPEPRILENVNLPAEFKITLKNENFCRDIIVGDEHNLIFVTDDSIGCLSEAEFWLCDGTFKTVPNIFIQLNCFNDIKIRNDVQGTI